MSAFSFHIVDVVKCLFQFSFFIVGYFLLSLLQMLLENFQGKILNFLVSEILNFLFHYSDNSLLLNTDDIINDDLLSG